MENIEKRLYFEAFREAPFLPFGEKDEKIFRPAQTRMIKQVVLNTGICTAPCHKTP